MPRYFKRSYKRYNRKYKGKKLTKFNLYKNRSSKAQAYQISRVNKKVNTIAKQLRPTTYRIIGNQSYIGWGAGLQVATPIAKSNPGHIMTIFPPVNGIEHCNYHGCRIHVDFMFDYPSSTYSVASNTTPEVVARFILIQYKSKRAQIGWADLTTNNPVMAGVFEPLDLHVNSKVKILKDFRLTINQKTPARHFNIKYNKNTHCCVSLLYKIFKLSLNLFLLLQLIFQFFRCIH